MELFDKSDKVKEDKNSNADENKTYRQRINTFSEDD